MGFAMLFIGFILLFGLASTVLWIWAIIDVVRNENVDSNMKIVWIVIIIMIPFIGSIVYFVAGRNQKQRVV